MKCGACAGSACVSCLVVGGAESDVVCSVHWCGVAVRGHVVGVLLGVVVSFVGWSAVSFCTFCLVGVPAEGVRKFPKARSQ